MDFTNGVYLEASGRAGRIENSYRNDDLCDFWGREAQYDTSSRYYGMHAGSGYVWELTEKSSLDIYEKFLWTRQKGDSVQMSTGETLVFDDVNSRRLRVGTRYSHSDDGKTGMYAGAAYEYEFDGAARASTNGYAIGVPTLQ